MAFDERKQIGLDALSAWGRYQTREFRRHGYPARSIIAKFRIDGGSFKERTPNDAPAIVAEIDEWLATRPLTERAVVALYYGFQMAPRFIATSLDGLALSPDKVSQIAQGVPPKLGRWLIKKSAADRTARAAAVNR